MLTSACWWEDVGTNLWLTPPHPSLPSFRGLGRKYVGRSKTNVGRFSVKQPRINRREPQPGGSTDDVPDVSQQPGRDASQDGGNPREAALDFRCPDCERTFATRRGVGVHRRQMHKEEANRDLEEPSDLTKKVRWGTRS
ncbi:hypothetical protein WA026_023421 [Henosepilachna vigintioctopunctata]|uniref:C2H2-type domain-containing protein n=1 Tax=Henosepilachna vigintioctopunctata TaxID=420089 RepID=A0AAW1TZI9_9CUCU